MLKRNSFTCMPLQDQMNQLHELLNELERIIICQICFQNRFNMIALFCGHPICADCVQQLQDDTTCPFCRDEVTLSLNTYN